MKIYKLLYLFMPITIILVFLWAPPAAILGETSRIIYFHVPIAWGAVLAYTVAAYYSIALLIKNDDSNNLSQKAYNSASIGVIFTILATVSGSLWAKLSWGSYWNWDPREISIAILLLIYIAYFALWSAIEDKNKRGKISSAYLIFAMVTMPFFIFVIPRIYSSLHPDTIINSQNKMQMEPAMRITLLISVISFTLLYGYILNLLNRITTLKNRVEEKLYD